MAKSVPLHIRLGININQIWKKRILVSDQQMVNAIIHTAVYPAIRDIEGYFKKTLLSFPDFKFCDGNFPVIHKNKAGDGFLMPIINLNPKMQCIFIPVDPKHPWLLFIHS